MCYWKHVTPQTERRQTHRRKTRKREKDEAETEEKRHVSTVIVPITWDSESLFCPVTKKQRQINIVIHNSRLNSPHFYCLHVLLWAIRCAVTVTNASQSIVGEISELTSGIFFFFALPLSFSFFFSSLSSKMGKEWSNGAKHIKRQQSSTNTIKPWSRNYFPRRGEYCCANVFAI